MIFQVVGFVEFFGLFFPPVVWGYSCLNSILNVFNYLLEAILLIVKILAPRDVYQFPFCELSFQ